MKRIFYFLVSAIVALGAVACQNDINEQIGANNSSDVVSFNVAFDEDTRIAMNMGEDSAKFTFEEGDKLYVKSGVGEDFYEFTNTADNLNQFSCRSAALVAELDNCNGNAYVYSRNGMFDSSVAGMDGILFTSGDYVNILTAEAITLSITGAVFHFTVPANTEVVLNAKNGETDYNAFYANGVACASVTYTAGEEAVEYYAHAIANTYTISYSVDGEAVKSVEKTWAKNTIYNLGTLTGAVATVNGVKYTDLQKAINAADGETVTLGSDVVVAEYLDIPASANVTLDLNGNNITTTPDNSYVLSNEKGGTVTINGNGGSMTGRIYNTGGEMVIKGGTFNTIVGDAYTLMNSTDGKLTVTDATVNGGSGFYGICGYNDNNEVILNNVNVTGTFGALCSYGVGAKMTVNGGTYEMSGIEGTTSHIAYFSTESTIVINDGTFSKIGEISLSGPGGGGICVNGGADLTINGGTFAGDYSDVYNYGGDITIKGGNYKFNPTASFIADGYKVTENANGTFTVAMNPVAALNEQIAVITDGSTITLTEDLTVANGEQIFIPEGSNVTLDLGGNTITGQIGTAETPATSNLGIINLTKGSKLTVKNGNITATVNSAYDGENWSYGYNSAIFFNNQGELIIEGGEYTISPESDGMIVCIVDNCSNWDLGNATTTIKGGKFTFKKNGGGGNIIRNRSNVPASLGVEYYATLNIEGGEFYGNSASIWYQQTQDTNLGRINISGGTFDNIRLRYSNTKFSDADNWSTFTVTGGEFTYYNATQLKSLAAAVNNGVSYAGATIKLGDNIDLSGEAWTPIGNTDYAHQFSGTFDGNGKTISNMTTIDTAYAGLFGRTCSAIIKNLTIDKATVNSNHYAAGILAWGESGATKFQIQNCKVTNSTITSAAENTGSGYDNGDKVGGIVGFAHVGIVSGCEVSETAIQGYRDLGGIVGYANKGTIENNKVSGVTITVDNTQNYKSYTMQHQYNVGSIIGRRGEAPTESDNTGEATINWGEIPAAVAMVGTTYYQTLAEAISKANGATITLLANLTNVTLNNACVIDTNNTTFSYTEAEGYRATVEGNIITVVKLDASEWGIVGGFNSWANDVKMYKTSTDNLFVAYGVEIKEVSGQTNGFKIRKNGAWGDAGNYGTLTTVNGSTKKVDTAIGVYTDGGSGNITVAYGTYDIYFDRLNSRVYVMTVGKEIAEATQQTTTTKYSFAGSVSGWDDSTPMVYAGDGIWTISRTFKANEEWKVKNHGNWNASWGYSNVYPDQTLVSGGSDGNAKTKADGDYIVGFVASKNKITFVKQ